MSYIRGEYGEYAAFRIITPSTLCHLIEREIPGAITCVMGFDAKTAMLRLVSGDTLPFALNNRMRKIPVGDDYGVSSAAAYWRRTIITTDISRDPRWEGYRQVAREAGLHSCASTPAITAEDGLLGVLTVFLKNRGGPHKRHTELMQAAATLLPPAIGTASPGSRQR